MCDGTWAYPRKGAECIYLDLLVVVLGNKAPEEIYKEIELIRARFNVFEIQ